MAPDCAAARPRGAEIRRAGVRSAPKSALARPPRTRQTLTIDNTVDPRFGVVGKRRSEGTGPLTRKRMETVDDEFIAAGVKFVERAKSEDKLFFV
jgi:hypothetical protein